MTILLSCGKQEFPDYSGEREVLEHQEAEATYTARFRILNPGRRRLSVSLLIWIKGRQIYFKTIMKNGEPHVRYQQHIHTGARCPDTKTNINVFELRQLTGDILIPLDKDIKFQEKGMEWFPVTNKHGNYDYSRATALPDLMHDLYQKDQNPLNGITKLERGEKLNLEERTIVIYGSATDPLKPVACGEITFQGYN